jgi:hypothetical protein
MATDEQGDKPMKFRKRPVVVEAIQFRVEDLSTHQHVNFGWPKAEGDLVKTGLDDKYWVQTLEGPLVVSDRDWIVTGTAGEHYPVKPDVFVTIYDPVVGDGD